MFALEVVLKGLRWQAGNGESISIWADKWLPSKSPHKLLSLIQILNESAKVSELIDTKKWEWKSKMVRQILCPMEVDLVLSIPLSLRLPSDKMVWAGTSNGKFSVQSA